jgi:ribonuclease HI
VYLVAFQLRLLFARKNAPSVGRLNALNNYVTIATDVSCDHKHKISVWACYIRYGGGTIKLTGQFKKYYKNTAKAETYALINALTIAHKQIPNWKDSKIVIHNEVEHVLTPIKTKAGNIRLKDVERSGAILSIALPILDETVSWDRRKIKAHYRHWKKSDNPAKYAINRWCDETSRAKMQEIREQIKRLR